MRVERGACHRGSSSALLLVTVQWADEDADRTWETRAEWGGGESGCCEHSCVRVSGSVGFHSWWVNTEERNCWGRRQA